MQHLEKVEGLCTNLSGSCPPTRACSARATLCRSSYLLANLHNKIESADWHRFIARFEDHKQSIASLAQRIGGIQKKYTALAKKERSRRRTFGELDSVKQRLNVDAEAAHGEGVRTRRGQTRQGFFYNNTALKLAVEPVIVDVVAATEASTASW